ncbi:MAG: hypothetical protein M1119_09130 [Firmicutes bacterium]|nr:hypothetical protein [Bacillota bacterium]
MYTTFSAYLPEQVEAARKLMEEKGYAKKTVENYSGVWHHLLKYADSKGIPVCTSELITQFAQYQYGIEDIFHPTAVREKYYARILLCLYDPEFDYSNITTAGAPFLDAYVPEVTFDV